MTTTEERLRFAESLLDRFSEECAERPLTDGDLWKDYFSFTGEHMIQTGDGWITGDLKQEMIDQGTEILDEVNGRVGAHRLTPKELWDRLPSILRARRSRAPDEFEGKANWVVMKHTIGGGNGAAWDICVQFGLDPEGTKIEILRAPEVPE